MYEYGLINLNTNERAVVFGRSFEVACERAKLNSADYEILFVEYVD